MVMLYLTDTANPSVGPLHLAFEGRSQKSWRWIICLFNSSLRCKNPHPHTTHLQNDSNIMNVSNPAVVGLSTDHPRVYLSVMLVRAFQRIRCRASSHSGKKDWIWFETQYKAFLKEPWGGDNCNQFHLRLQTVIMTAAFGEFWEIGWRIRLQGRTKARSRLNRCNLTQTATSSVSVNGKFLNYIMSLRIFLGYAVMFVR